MNISKENLKIAIKNAFDKRNTKADIIEVQIEKIKNSKELSERWQNYRNSKSYARNIKFEDTLKALEEILNMIYQEDIKTININLEIISDSAYVVNAINLNWLQKWRSNNFKNTDGKDIKNIDLWKKLMSILDELFFLEVRIKFTKIKGHNGNYFNEMVDQLAKEEIKKNVKKAGI